MKTAEQTLEQARKFKKGDVDIKTGLVFWRRERGKDMFMPLERYNKREEKLKSTAEERYLTKGKEYYELNKHEISKRNKAKREQGMQNKPMNYLLLSCRTNATRRKHKFELKIDDLNKMWNSQGGKCYYSGVKMIKGLKTNSPNQMSLDRIDSSKGYIQGNVVMCAQSMNFAKSNFSESIARKFVLEIAEAQFRQQWVSVEERSPEICQNVLVVQEGSEEPLMSHYCEAGFKVEKYVSDNDRVITSYWSDVTHWMPLPIHPSHE